MNKLSSWHIEISVILMIILVATYLRFWNLEMNPAWYSDEATHVEIVRNILNGESRYFAVDESFLLFARLPLFEYSLAVIFRFFGVGMLSLRGFTASLGLISVLLLYLFIRDIGKSSYMSLLAAFAYAIMPQAVLYNRFGFSYNLLLPLILLALWGAVRYQHSGSWRWLGLMSLCIGLGSISEFLAWSFLPLVLFIGNNWRDRVLALLLALLPLGIFCVSQVLLVPEAFLFDLGYSLGRTGGGAIPEQMARLAENISILMLDGWWLMGLIGIFLLKDAALRRTCLIFLLPLVLIARTVPLYSLSAYYTLPFLPIVAIGLGSFFYHGLQFAWQKLSESFGRLLALGIIGLIFLLPLGYIGIEESEKIRGHYPTAIDAFLLNPADVLAVVDYVRANSTETETVIASAPIAALLDGHGVEFQMAVVAMGHDAIHVPHDLAPERLAYSADFRQAKYVIVDNLWRNWAAIHMPAIGEILAEVEGWEMVFEAGSIQIYENPAR